MGVELLQGRCEDIQRIAARHGAYNVRVFGSFARGDAGPPRDLDLLISVGPKTTPWFPGGLVADLEQLLGRRVECGRLTEPRRGINGRASFSPEVEPCSGA